ncbi:MAG TPA: complex I NDUFA9 subunit family protein [Usitatibacter sp.]|jgi:NADH dehydrogenase|nr:complex I NDUFA9 subunit family protein [Usitatibacter sp.]
MDISRICIFGGTGFVGRSIVEQAYARGLGVRVVTAYPPKAMPITVVPTVEILAGDVFDDSTLDRACEDMDAVVNLVGILHPSRGKGFDEVHVALPRRIARACHGAGVQHVVHMSALGADEKGPSEYQRSKARGEAALRQAAGILPWTVFRPSVIFGEGDRFLNLFAALAKSFPVIPLAGAQARFQPVWVEDVARCFVEAVGETRAFGQVFPLCGPKAYTLAELVDFVARTLGLQRRIWPLPPALARLQAAVLEHLPGKLMTRDNLASMSVDNTCDEPFPVLFGFKPTPLEAVAPLYLAGASTRERYQRYRHVAGR